MIYRGTVTHIDASGTYVEVPNLGLGNEYLCDTTIAGLLALDRVIVGIIAGIKDDLIILGKVV